MNNIKIIDLDNLANPTTGATTVVVENDTVYKCTLQTIADTLINVTTPTLYSVDGALADNRTVDFDSNNLTFDGGGGTTFQINSLVDITENTTISATATVDDLIVNNTGTLTDLVVNNMSTLDDLIVNGVAEIDDLVVVNDITGNTGTFAGLITVDELVSNNGITGTSLDVTNAINCADLNVSNDLYVLNGTATIADLTVNNTAGITGTATVGSLLSNAGITGTTTNISGQSTVGSLKSNGGITGTTTNITTLKITSLQSFTGNTAAISGGLVVGDLYRDGDSLKIVH